MKRKAFTLTEILVVISIIILLASLSFPLFQRAKFSANKTACISNLRQIGVAINLYREQHDGTDGGTAAAMGLPEEIGPNFSSAVLFCHGNDPRNLGYSRTYPDGSSSQEQQRAWAQYVQLVGNSAVILFDDNHQGSYPKSLDWEVWSAMGLQLDGGVVVRRRMGFPRNYYWWHPEVKRSWLNQG